MKTKIINVCGYTLRINPLRPVEYKDGDEWKELIVGDGFGEMKIYPEDACFKAMLKLTG